LVSQGSDSSGSRFSNKWKAAIQRPDYDGNLLFLRLYFSSMLRGWNVLSFIIFMPYILAIPVVGQTFVLFCSA